MESHEAAFSIGVATCRGKDMPRAAPYCRLSAPARCFLSSRTLAGGQGGRGPHQTRPRAVDSPNATRPAPVLVCAGQSINTC